MSILKNIKVRLPSEMIDASTITPHGMCACGAVAFDVIARVCNTCAPCYNINTFPDYTYPSELMYTDPDLNVKRLFHFRSNNH